MTLWEGFFSAISIVSSSFSEIIAIGPAKLIFLPEVKLGESSLLKSEAALALPYGAFPKPASRPSAFAVGLTLFYD